MNRVVYELSREKRSRRAMVCIRVCILPSQRKESSVIRGLCGSNLGFSSSRTISYIALLFSVLSISLSALVLPP